MNGTRNAHVWYTAQMEIPFARTKDIHKNIFSLILAIFKQSVRHFSIDAHFMGKYQKFEADWFTNTREEFSPKFKICIRIFSDEHVLCTHARPGEQIFESILKLFVPFNLFHKNTEVKSFK